MSNTTIQITEDTKGLLDQYKQNNESYNDVVRRLAGKPKGQLWTEEEIEEKFNQLIQEYGNPGPNRV